MARKHRSSHKKPSRNSKKDWYSIEGFDKDTQFFEQPRNNRNSQNNKITLDHSEIIKTRQVEITPRGENQKKYVYQLENPNTYITFGIGPAGCGKTLLATQVAVKGLIEGRYKKIVITRPNVAVDDRDIGFIPGSMHQKMAGWLMPINDIFLEYFSPNEIKKMMNDLVIDVVPIAYIRGRTFKDAFIIVDEAQGTTPNSLLSILTRIGTNSKLVITGDLDQKDHKHLDGLTDFVRKHDRAGHLDGVSVIKFNNTDVQRHPVIPEILKLYASEETVVAAKTNSKVHFKPCDA